MICIIALVVFSILGIFSASHRKIAAKAFDCVFRRVTLRPCNSGLDQQLKSQIVGFVSKRNVKAAKFVVKNFEIISWFFTILMLASMVYTAIGIYNYAVYGNCNGKGSHEICIYDVLNPIKDETVCTDPSIQQGTVTSKPSVDDDPSIGPVDAPVTIIEFGCYSCPNTRNAEPVVKEIIKNYGNKVRFVYRDFHIPAHPGSEIRAEASQCANDQGKFWEFHEILFARQEENLTDTTLIDISGSLGLDTQKFRECLASGKYVNETQKDFEDGKAAGVMGTPTFFINNQTVVGKKPYPYMKNIIDSELRAKGIDTGGFFSLLKRLVGWK